jgi:hypothetical protein
MWHVLVEQKCIQGFQRKTLKKETTWKTWDIWEDNTEMDIKGTGWASVDAIHLA